MTQENIQPAITFLNLTGDVSVSWTPDNADAMLALIDAKMKQGFSFFIVKPRVLAILGSKKVRATSIEEIAAAGQVKVADADFKRMMGQMQLHDKELEGAVASGTAHLTKSETPVDHNTIRRATTAAEVAKSQTIAVRRIVGG
jgi:Na+-translocating ferredoxin:NAD+ oxidoreductase RNF subunit RnfB